MYDRKIFEKMRTSCTLCARECGVNRSAGERGYCGMGEKPVVARASLHMWEEPVLSGTNGSGTVFFSGCSLACRFCQNEAISRGKAGAEIGVNRLAEIYSELEAQGAHNINLVTPTHFILPIVESLALARKRGLNVPIVYNTSSYETEAALELLGGSVDIFLADAKYHSDELAISYSDANDYFAVCQSALKKMYSLVGRAEFDEAGMMQKGIIIRILLLPGQTDDAKSIVKALYSDFGDDVYFSLMSQYTPTAAVMNDERLNRTVTTEEYGELVEYARGLGITNGFVQEGGAAQESFIPQFDLRGVFGM